MFIVLEQFFREYLVRRENGEFRRLRRLLAMSERVWRVSMNRKTGAETTENDTKARMPEIPRRDEKVKTNPRPTLHHHVPVRERSAVTSIPR